MAGGDVAKRRFTRQLGEAQSRTVSRPDALHERRLDPGGVRGHRRHEGVFNDLHLAGAAMGADDGHAGRDQLLDPGPLRAGGGRLG